MCVSPARHGVSHSRLFLFLLSCVFLFLPCSAQSDNVTLRQSGTLQNHENSSLKRLKNQAKKEKNQQLSNALKAVEACQKLHHKLDISQKELIQIALFIETDLKKYIAEKKYYLHPKETRLACPIEYDPKTGSLFIHLRGILGGGAYKTITCCIRYDVKAPELFAACTQTANMDKEIEMAKALRGSTGLLQMRAVTYRYKDGVVYHTLFCKLYQPGSLATLLDTGSIQFTLDEKIAIALDILKGLEAMQAKGIVHRDLKKENYLVDIQKNKKNKRTVKAVICDFGYASYAHEAFELKAQGTTAYIAPEGLFVSTMHGADYYKTDLFAAGCVLYRLFYNKKPEWQISTSAKDSESTNTRYKRLIACLEKETGEARDQILAKLAKGIKLSQKEALENVILSMVHPNPLNRSTASQLRRRLEEMNKRFHKKAE